MRNKSVKNKHNWKKKKKKKKENYVCIGVCDTAILFIKSSYLYGVKNDIFKEWGLFFIDRIS